MSKKKKKTKRSPAQRAATRRMLAARTANPANPAPKKHKKKGRRRNPAGVSMLEALAGVGVGVASGVVLGLGLNILAPVLPAVARHGIRLVAAGGALYLAGTYPAIGVGAATALAVPVVRDVLGKVSPILALGAVEPLALSPRQLAALGAVGPSYFYGQRAMDAVEAGRFEG